MRACKRFTILAAGLAVITALAACSSSKVKATTTTTATTTSTASSAAPNSSAPSSPIKIGILADLTGVAASGYTTVEKGVKAYVDAANAGGGINGQKITYVMADTGSTPAGALTSTQRLVQTDKVFAIISLNSTFYGAETYALKEGIPVIGQGLDGPEWNVKSNTNLFSTNGVTDYNKVYTTIGLEMKALGATSCASVGYSSSPSSQKSAETAVTSCQSQGLKGGYVTQIAFGSTDVGPIALAIKKAGVSGVYMPTVPNTAFALAGALRQIGVTPKAYILATGYGGDLLASPAAVAAAQGYQFSSIGQPVEMHTAATEKFAKNLASVGETQTPTFAEQTAYISIAALACGLQASGPNPTRQKFMSSLRGVSDFDAEGLLAPEKVNFSDYSPAETCSWILTLKGKEFVPVPGIPFCGKATS